MIYLNSFFDPRFSLPVLALKILIGASVPPVICAPRGELATGAMEQKSLRKQIYIFAFKFFGLPRKVALHATSDQEVKGVTRKAVQKIKGFCGSEPLLQRFSGNTFDAFGSSWKG